MRKLCCACHSSSIAALIYIIAVPDMHGQKVDTENYQIAARQSPGPITSAAVQTGRPGALTSHRPDDATIGPSLLFWRVGARSGFCPISESTMDLASRFASLAVWR